MKSSHCTKNMLPVVLTPEELLRGLGELGLTNEEIAGVFGLTGTELETILANDQQLAELLDSAKATPNRRVEASLYKRALGFQIRETVHTAGHPTKVTIKEILPDVLACIFWLKNRDPKKWRDTLEVSHTLRDRFDRAHRALQIGMNGRTGGMKEDQETEDGGLKS